MLVNCKDLQFVGDSVDDVARYRLGDLEELSDYGTDMIVVKDVRCNINDCSNTLHPAVILQSDDGTYDFKAALPCPPHCGGKRGWITYSGYLALKGLP